MSDLYVTNLSDIIVIQPPLRSNGGQVHQMMDFIQGKRYQIVAIEEHEKITMIGICKDIESDDNSFKYIFSKVSFFYGNNEHDEIEMRKEIEKMPESMFRDNRKNLKVNEVILKNTQAPQTETNTQGIKKQTNRRRQTLPFSDQSGYMRGQSGGKKRTKRSKKSKRRTIRRHNKK